MLSKDEREAMKRRADMTAGEICDTCGPAVYAQNAVDDRQKLLAALDAVDDRQKLLAALDAADKRIAELEAENAKLRASWSLASEWVVVEGRPAELLVERPTGDRKRISTACPEKFDAMKAALREILTKSPTLIDAENAAREALKEADR